MDQISEERLKRKMAEYRYGALRVEVGFFSDDMDSVHIMGSVLVVFFRGECPSMVT